MISDRAQVGGDRELKWGSDVVAELLRRLEIEYVCLNPGSSFRGLQDSLVNYLGNERPKLLLSLHEESVVSIAHGYAKATGKPMGAVMHTNVGLMHGMMAIFNAWCDRVPILMLGATGAVDSAVRRSWIDWVHTVRDQGALVRPMVKWDEQPASPSAIVDAMLRAYGMACTPPCGPSYVVLDRRLQEDRLAAPVTIPDVRRFAPPVSITPAAETLRPIAAMLEAATKPVILIGRVSGNQEDWDARVKLAERLNAVAVTDLRTRATFPTDHPLHAGPATQGMSASISKNHLESADVLLSLDWPDLGDVQKQAKSSAKVVHISVDQHVHHGWGGEHQRLPAVDVFLATEPDSIIQPLLEILGSPRKKKEALPNSNRGKATPVQFDERLPTLPHIGLALSSLRKGRKFCLARTPLNWPSEFYHFHDPLDYLGYDGGGGVGSGPGMTVGTALGLEGTGRTTIGIIGDGEFLAAPTALWTASHYRLPVLFIIANNRTYYTDEVQQELVARQRGRIPENKWIGQRIDDPPVDIAGLARNLGFEAEGPVTQASALTAALERGVKAAESGKCYLIDVAIDSERGTELEWLPQAMAKS